MNKKFLQIQTNFLEQDEPQGPAVTTSKINFQQKLDAAFLFQKSLNMILARNFILCWNALKEYNPDQYRVRRHNRSTIKPDININYVRQQRSRYFETNTQQIPKVRSNSQINRYIKMSQGQQHFQEINRSRRNKSVRVINQEVQNSRATILQQIVDKLKNIRKVSNVQQNSQNGNQEVLKKINHLQKIIKGLKNQRKQQNLRVHTEQRNYTQYHNNKFNKKQGQNSEQQQQIMKSFLAEIEQIRKQINEIKASNQTILKNQLQRSRASSNSSRNNHKVIKQYHYPPPPYFSPYANPHVYPYFSPFANPYGPNGQQGPYNGNTNGNSRVNMQRQRQTVNQGVQTFTVQKNTYVENQYQKNILINAQIQKQRQIERERQKQRQRQRQREREREKERERERERLQEIEKLQRQRQLQKRQRQERQRRQRQWEKERQRDRERERQRQWDRQRERQRQEQRQKIRQLEQKLQRQRLERERNRQPPLISRLPFQRPNNQRSNGNLHNSNLYSHQIENGRSNDISQIMKKIQTISASNIPRPLQQSTRAPINPFQHLNPIQTPMQPIVHSNPQVQVQKQPPMPIFNKPASTTLPFTRPRQMQCPRVDNIKISTNAANFVRNGAMDSNVGRNFGHHNVTFVRNLPLPSTSIQTGHKIGYTVNIYYCHHCGRNCACPRVLK